jgi:4-amino-4-deoxy-L-arabinose transferase-like glycosyltransferase/cytochrome c-type biogenesis protein CcmH/NrfG
MKSAPWVGYLVIFGLAIALIDLTWLSLDRSIPSWDPADHLIGSLNYWWTVENAQWLSGQWWHNLWTLSSKYPPLLYISSAPLLSLLGRGIDQAVGVNLLFTALLLGTVYGLGATLFRPEVGFWAAVLCGLFPRFYSVRTEYFMDYPLVALTTLAFLLMTRWRMSKGAIVPWLWAIAFGLSLGLSLLMKQSALFFFVVPSLWVCGVILRQLQWGRLVQLVLGWAIATAMMLPWTMTNWLFQVSAGFNANVKSAIAEGDPPLDTPAAWFHYLLDLPKAVSLPLLAVSLAGLGFGLLRSKGDRTVPPYPNALSPVRWLLVFFLGSYLVWSAVLNKDHRYIMPYLPIVAVLLGYGMAQWGARFRLVPWLAIALSFGLMLLNLFPIGGSWGGAIASRLAPDAQRMPYLGEPYPHQAVVDALIQAEPYQTINLGLLHSSGLVNQHNFTYFGNRRDFRVYARRVGNTDRHLDQGVRSLSWFLYHRETQRSFDSAKTRSQRRAVLDQLRQSGEFERYKAWKMPDDSSLVLFRRRQLPVTVEPIERGNPNAPVRLAAVEVSPQAPPGQPLAVSYTWEGSWQQLHDGLLLLSWVNEADPNSAPAWIHDHSIGLGSLHPGPIQANQTLEAPTTANINQPFRVTERTAMLPPPTLPSGTYRLQAIYLNRRTGETYPVAAVSARVTLSPDAPSAPAPEVDWVTQLRTQAKALPEGIAALDPIFDQLGQINLYDPNQTYTVQAETSLGYRLQADPTNRDYAYGLALARVLQRKVDPAIAALKTAVSLDAQNPNAYAYLAFVNLYAFRGRAAQEALEPALELDPNSVELNGLRAIAALQQGHLIDAWKHAQIAL